MSRGIPFAWAFCIAIASLSTAQPDKGSTPNIEGGPAVFGPLPGQTCVNSHGTNCTGTILDNDTITTSFDVSDCHVIEDVNVGVELTHTFIGDLIITVEGPSTTQAGLFTSECGSNDNLWVVYDDEAGGPLACGVGVHDVGNSYQPNPGPLSAFDGESGTGTWTLYVQDTFGADAGQMTDWSLELTCAAPVPATPGPWKAILAAILVLSGLAVLARRRASD